MLGSSSRNLHPTVPSKTPAADLGGLHCNKMDGSGHQSRIQAMAEGAAAEIYSYKSPYSQRYEGGQGDFGDEVDLGEIDDPHSHPASLRPSFDYGGDRPLVMPMPSFKESAIDYTCSPRGSKFTEVFRTLSRSLTQNNITRSLRGRDAGNRYKNAGFAAPQSRPPMDGLAQKYGMSCEALS
jgi:hypothetical protein